MNYRLIEQFLYALNLPTQNYVSVYFTNNLFNEFNIFFNVKINE